MNKTIEVQNIKINIINFNNDDYICISDFTKFKNGKSASDDIIKNWLRNRITLEFLGTWESMYNSNFNSVEFDGFIRESGLHTFTLSVSQWCNKTNAIGIYAKRGKHGGTYAHKDIAFEFASAISPVFKLYLIKEFQRLKLLENQNKEWNIKRILTKNNYLIHTDAIKNYILPDNDFYKNKEWLKYAEEADILNVILFHTTAKKWRELNPELAKNSNVRDYATINELTVLSNLGQSIHGVSSNSISLPTLIQFRFLVTPGLFPTLVTFLFTNLFIKVDLPTLGIPTTKARVLLLANPLLSFFLFSSFITSLVKFIKESNLVFFSKFKRRTLYPFSS